MKTSEYLIGLVTYPLEKAGLTPVSDLITIFTYIFGKDKILLISGDEVIHLNARDIKLFFCKGKENFVKKTLKLIVYTIKSALLYNVKVFIFTLGAEILFPAIIILKLLRRKTIALLAGDTVKVYKVKHDYKYPLASISWFISSIFVDRIIVYSPAFIRAKINSRYLLRKVRVASHHILDFNVFKFKSISEDISDIIIGYVGRLSPEKNPLNLLLAFYLLKKKYHLTRLRLIIIGDGSQRELLMKLIKKMDNTISFVRWCPREELIKYYHSFTLLVLPSYTEGLPYVLLEAMACGTPVIAAPVGAIPDIVKEGLTGFLLESQNAVSIAKKIANVLRDREQLKRVRRLAHLYLRKKFTLEYNVQRWRVVLAELDKCLIENKCQ